MGDSAPTSEPSLPGNDTARAFLCVAFLTTFIVAGILWPTWLPIAPPILSYALPAVVAGGLILAIRLARQGPGSAPPLAAWLGIAVIVGAGAFDMAATFVHTPDLSQESNPIARALLDSGHSVRFVLTYGLLAQGLYLSCASMLWVALLRHRPCLIGSVRGEPTFLRFLKAATGGAGLTWRQWMLPLRWSELPTAYHVLWLMAVVLWSGAVDRVFVGLEWFKLVPRIRWQVVCVGEVVGIAVYFTWLWRASREQPSCDTPRARDSLDGST
jgi:hypothetical protein